MKFFLALGLMLASASCTTTGSQFPEQGRSYFYMGCLGLQNTVAICGCAEEKIVDEMGPINLLEENPPEDKVLQFNTLFESSIESCKAGNSTKM